MNKVQPFDWKPPFQNDQRMRSLQRYTSKQLFAVFWPYLRPHRGRIALAILALVLVAGALLGMGRGLAYLLTKGL